MRIVDLALQAVYKGTGQRNKVLERGGSGCKNANQRGRNSWQKGSGKKGSKGEEKGEQDTLQRGVERAATQICTPLMKMRVKTFKKHVTMMKSGKRGVYWQKV